MSRMGIFNVQNGEFTQDLCISGMNFMSFLAVGGDSVLHITRIGTAPKQMDWLNVSMGPSR